MAATTAQARRSRRGRRGGGLRTVLRSPLSLLILAGLAWMALRFGEPLLRWLVLDADWSGSAPEDCRRQGACWVFVRVHMEQFLFGLYPQGERWRVLAGFLVPALAAAVLLARRFQNRDKYLLALLFAGPLFTLVLLVGGVGGLVHVPTTRWGGLLVTLVVGVLGILLSVPLGTLLALGRQSAMPVLRLICVIYIEVWRGVPLLGVLFMATLLLPLTLPPNVSVSQFFAVMAGIILYAAAYIAEIVRGGLQGVSRIQTEAAEALGFSYWGRMRVVILPQALHKVIPALVGVFINLFKSSTLVMVVGVFDILGVVQNAAHSSRWAGNYIEGYVFAALIFWSICYSISVYSGKLERRREHASERR